MTQVRGEATGLKDRRAAEHRLQDAIRVLREQRQPISVILAEVDGSRGDQDVVAAAGVLQGNLRSEDFVGHWVGDELICILTRCTAQDATRIVDRCRDRVSLSCGVTEVRLAERSADTVDRASQLMRKSKAQGRNRVSAG